MNLKTVLVTALLFVIFMGFMSFALTTYVLYNDATSQAGDKLVNAHQLLFYLQLSIHILTFGLGVGIFFKS